MNNDLINNTEKITKFSDSFNSLCRFQMFRRGRRQPWQATGRSLTDEKSIAQTFIQFLEKNNLKNDMPESDLRNIYQSQFCLQHRTPTAPFPRVLNALKYHLNLCQQLGDRVIFGGGEAAALQMLSIDDPDESSSEEDEFSKLIHLVRPRCKICKRTFRNNATYESHLDTVTHRQQSILKSIRQSVEK